jgi:hypothetical protein
MGVNSYAEIFTTLIGWHLYGVIWDVLASTGIVYLPFLWIILENWRAAFIDGEEAGGAAAGLRAIEVELYIGLFVMLIACVPNGITTLNRADVFYAPPATTANPTPVTATGASPQSTFGSTLGGTPPEVRVPAWWYTVMAISSGVTTAIISGAGLSLDDLRKVVDASRRASIDDARLRYEAQRFYNECYVPARSKYLSNPLSAAAEAALAMHGQDDTEWIGSHAFREDPDLYPIMHAERQVPGWPVDPVRDADQATAPIPPDWGRPTCKEWWEGGTVPGIQAKIIAAVDKVSRLHTLVQTFGASLSEERRTDIVTRTVLDKTRLTVIPNAYVPTNDGVVKDTFSSTTVMIAGFFTTFFTWLATAVLKPVLPFIQCLLLLGVYMLLPLVMVMGKYSVSTMMTGAIAIFTIKMWSVLWFVTDFLDDKLALAIYPDASSALAALSSFYKIGDPTKAMLLNLIVMSLYLVLPALFSALMGAVGVHVASSLSSSFLTAYEPVKATGNRAEKIIGKGARGAGNALPGASRSLRARNRSNSQRGRS